MPISTRALPRLNPQPMPRLPTTRMARTRSEELERQRIERRRANGLDGHLGTVNPDDFVVKDVGGGIIAAVPMTFETLGVFKGMQRAVNAYIRKFGVDANTLDVDGRIGPLTLAATKAVVEHAIFVQKRPIAVAIPSDVAQTAEDSDSYASVIASIANEDVDFSPDPAPREPTTPPSDGGADSNGETVPRRKRGIGGKLAMAGIALAGLVAARAGQEDSGF